MRRLLEPVVILGGAILADRFGPLAGLSATFPVQLSRIIFAVVFCLAWRFQRGRVVWAVALVAVAAEGFSRGVPEREVLEPAVVFLVPLNLAVLGFLRDWRVLSWTGAWRFAVLLAQAGAVAALERPGLEKVREWLTTPLVGVESAVGWLGLGWLGLTGAGLAASLAAAVTLVYCVARYRTPIEAGLLGTLAAVFVASVRAEAETTYYLTVAGLVLGLSLIESAFSLAFEDGLTGLPARRSLEENLRHLGRTYAIGMVDLDHFKKLNDRHGHEVGDQVLQMVAAKLARVGGGGKAFRYGGEEFTVVFSGKTAAVAKPVLDELRKTVAGTSFAVRSPGRPKKKPKGGRSSGSGAATKKLRVTVSIGLAERSDKNRLPEEVMKAADKALYRSKKAGRNRVTAGK